MAALLMLGACESHGVVGSNVSAGLNDESGEGSASATSHGDSAPTTTGLEPDSGGGGGSTGEIGGGGVTTDDFIFDVATDDPPEICFAPMANSCDQDSDDPWQALGIDCPGATEMSATFTGHPAAMTVHEGALGTRDVFSPREGERMVILSTGRAGDVPRTHSELGCSDPLFCPSTALDPSTVLDTLPAPLDVQAVSGHFTCDQEPGLVGTGDCSNTLEKEWAAGSGALDYAEIRIKATVPPNTDGFAYQFAFFSAEYPVWADGNSPWNDMYVAWLESEAWTGNISFDDHGNPISVSSVFLDYLDAESPLCTVDPCVAPELDGFAMDGHAGTRWLETTAPVVPGEDIQVVFALFDLSDALFDTVVILDNVHWGCTDLPPITQPEG